MPILVKDYKWTETPSHIHIQVPLKGVSGSKADVFCGEEYVKFDVDGPYPGFDFKAILTMFDEFGLGSVFLLIICEFRRQGKVHYPPYLFEVLLYKLVDDGRSGAVIRDNVVSLTLFKYEEELWGRLLSPKADDKKFVLARKIEALEAAQKKKEEELERKRVEKDRTKKYTVNEMLKLEQGDRARIEEIKTEERTRTERELEEWKVSKKLEAERQLLNEIDALARAKLQQKDKPTPDDVIFNTADVITDVEMEAAAPAADVIEEEEETENSIAEVAAVKPEVEAVKPEVEAAKIRKSGIRQSSSITISFTPRAFPTPIRESKTQEEKEWLEKQAESRKSYLVEDPDLRQHEQDPDWLIDKANQLFGAGDVQGAVNAITLAIRIRPKMPLLYTNRAACHLKLRNLYKALDDSSKALELMQPEVGENAKLRLKSHMRRATAFCELELYVEALQDYEAALKIEPGNEALLEDARRIRQVIQTS